LAALNIKKDVRSWEKKATVAANWIAWNNMPVEK